MSNNNFQQQKPEIRISEHKVPEQIITPNTVQTRLGTLEFFDGFPTKETTQKVYDNYLRLYGPTEAYYDKSWKMPDIKRID